MTRRSNEALKKARETEIQKIKDQKQDFSKNATSLNSVIS